MQVKVVCARGTSALRAIVHTFVHIKLVWCVQLQVLAARLLHHVPLQAVCICICPSVSLHNALRMKFASHGVLNSWQEPPGLLHLRWQLGLSLSQPAMRHRMMPGASGHLSSVCGHVTWQSSTVVRHLVNITCETEIGGMLVIRSTQHTA
jgi:hypothetical protein